MSNTTLKVSQQLVENTKSRYLMTTELSESGLADKTAPQQIATNKITPGLTYISPNLASICEGKAIPFETLFSQLDISVDELKALFTQIRNNNVLLVSLGYGGISMNVIHMMSKLAELVDESDIFSKFIIYEEDSLTLMNALRMYKNTTSTNCDIGIQNKLSGFTEYNLCKRDNIFLCDYFFDEDLYEKVKDRKDNIVYFGAPDFKARKMMEKAPFYFLGHGGDEVSIIVRPVVNSELTNETYGQINLATFFPNMLMLTVEFLKHLAVDSQATSGDDVEIFKYTHNGDK